MNSAKKVPSNYYPTISAQETRQKSKQTKKQTNKQTNKQSNILTLTVSCQKKSCLIINKKKKTKQYNK